MCGVSGAARLFSPDRGVQKVSFRMSLIDRGMSILRLPSAVVGRRPGQRHCKVATLVRRSPSYGSSTTTTWGSGSKRCLFGACGRRRKWFPTENRSTTARDTHCGSTNFFSESDSQTAGLVPGSASAILTSLPPSFHDQRTREESWRPAPYPGASKSFFRALASSSTWPPTNTRACEASPDSLERRSGGGSGGHPEPGPSSAHGAGNLSITSSALP